MPAVSSLDANVLRRLCDVLGDTHDGLTGTEIGSLLGQVGIEDVLPTATKRHRLFEALAARQKTDRSANNVLAFVKAAMSPVRYTGGDRLFEARRGSVNEVLAFAGLQVGEDGELTRVSPVSTLDEAQQRAARLRRELVQRGVHREVLRFCEAELLEVNYFHAVFEATKSVADRLRQMTGLTGDGARLAEEALSVADGTPLLAINPLRTPTERSEQMGLQNLIKGMFGMFRNVTAHEPRISWPIDEPDAFDLLTLASLIHRKLDVAVPTRPPDGSSAT